MPLNRKQFGSDAENLAKNYLLQLGYRFVTANYTCHLGEIDLIFIDNDQIVFAEVKARHHTRFGQPQEAINHTKLKKLSQTALHYFTQHPHGPQHGRLDALAIDYSADPPRITHLKNISPL